MNTRAGNGNALFRGTERPIVSIHSTEIQEGAAVRRAFLWGVLVLGTWSAFAQSPGPISTGGRDPATSPAVGGSARQEALPGPQPTPRPDLASLPKAGVVHVIDGDTVILFLSGKEQICRLIGVDAPETVAPEKPVEAFGPEASRFLHQLLAGEEVWVAVDQAEPRTDVYGRMLAYLFRVPDGLFVNLEIVRQGYGRAELEYNFPYRDVFRDYQARAGKAQKGLWQTGPAATQPPLTPAAAILPVKTPQAIQAPPSQSQPQPQDDAIVYVTKTGKAYHRAGCRFLAKSRIPMPLGEARKRYKPCSVCKPPL
jgi:micrococcal nuclease